MAIALDASCTSSRASAHQAIREFGAGLNSGQPAGLSGRTVTVVAEGRVAGRRPAEVFRYVRYPMNWMARGGHLAERPGQAFRAWLAPPYRLSVQGQLLEVRPSRTVVFTWAFTRAAAPGMVIGAPEPGGGHLPPDHSMTIETRLRHSGADTVVTITSREVPVEWSGRLRALWAYQLACVKISAAGFFPGHPPWWHD